MRALVVAITALLLSLTPALAESAPRTSITLDQPAPIYAGQVVTFSYTTADPAAQILVQCWQFSMLNLVYSELDNAAGNSFTLVWGLGYMGSADPYQPVECSGYLMLHDKDGNPLPRFHGSTMREPFTVYQ